MGLGMEEEDKSWGKPRKQPPELPTPICFHYKQCKGITNRKNNVEEVMHALKSVF